ncbi:pilus (MSHA type) biogenesis protein MshL [Usitatibacter palustris]|uniref:pilus (MSHA type) biogenesis protein MshL n=1 Tax=Usitatibacter palustris TaxID=2732487 RepID=UPI001487A6C2|nr:pilus (MSHA type) biogenesis protein MshL [Usitatibacter palustris]
MRTVPLPPAPSAKPAEVRYSVVVANQPVREVLLAMARESKTNFDIHPNIEGSVTLNAIDQSLQQILDRITRQIPVRYEVHGQTITVMPDTPYLKSYKVNYVNMSRETTETNSIATQVISGAIGTNQGGSSSDNNSTLRITSIARNRFWETLEANIKDILKESDKRVDLGSSAGGTPQAPPAAPAPAPAGGAPGQAPAASQPEAASRGVQPTSNRFVYEAATPVIVSPETGIITVRASARQHEKVAEFLEQIGASASRQVVIEATIVEVTLSDRYQSGVDWSALAIDGLGYSVVQSFAGSVVNLSNPAGPPISIGYSNPNSGVGNLTSTVKLLSQFGSTRVLSSPLLMVLNNQTATLKVVDNRVYFNIKADTVDTANVGSRTTFTTTQNVVPVGLIMHITPQISDQDEVILNVRPTVTAITGFVDDPNPALRGSLTQAAIPNRIPETRTREMQSVLKVTSGRTAILGGLMLDSFEGQRDGVPIASRIPIFGDFFSYRNDRAIRSELVIFVRPIVVRDPSVETDLAAYKRFLPNSDFFKGTQGPFPEFEESLGRLERGEVGPAPEPESPPPGSPK